MKTAPGLWASSCLLIAACASNGTGRQAPDEGLAGTANPASAYCQKQGGQLETITDSEGNQIGLCHLPDGELIEEWELFRRDHPEPR